MPTTDDVLRGKAACKALPAKWTRDLLGGSRRSWDARRSEECSICDEHRQRRCRVLYRGDQEKMRHVKFLDAPLIHPYNAPKYHASLIRAQQYAFRTGRILLWAAAEDQPCHPDHTGLSQVTWRANGLSGACSTIRKQVALWDCSRWRKTCLYPSRQER